MKKTLVPYGASSWFVFFLVNLLSLCQGAPRRATSTYDQRQDGKYNVHAKLDNFLIVIAPSSSSAATTGQSNLGGLLQNDLLSQVFDLKNVAARIGGAHNDRRHRDDNSQDNENEEKIELRVSGQQADSSNLRSAIKSIIEHETEDRDGLEIITIVQKKLPLNLEQSEQLSDPPVDDGDTAPSIIPELQTQSTDDEYDTSKLKKNGRSLETLSGVSSVGNNVGETVNKPGNVVLIQRDDEPQELKLLGDGVENCGPERYRDRYGICRFRAEP